MGVTTMNEKAPLDKRRSKSEAHREVSPGSKRSAANPPEDLEFEEFCEAGSDPVDASPEFKENLRKKLMQLVKNLYGLWVLFLGGMIHYH